MGLDGALAVPSPSETVEPALLNDAGYVQERRPVFHHSRNGGCRGHRDGYSNASDISEAEWLRRLGEAGVVCEEQGCERPVKRRWPGALWYPGWGLFTDTTEYIE